MRSDSPLVSVIMPVFNCEKYVGEAIESIIKQTYYNWELLICDDYSTDDSLVVIRKYASVDKRITYYANRLNCGAASVRNFLIERSQGELVALMDADDKCDSRRFEAQIELMKNRRLDACGTNHCTIDDCGRVTAYYRNPAPYQQILWSAFNNFRFCNASLLIKRECLLKINGYDERWNTEAEDIDMLFRFLLSRYKIESLDECYYFYRLHGQNVSNRNNEVQQRNSYSATGALLNTILEEKCSDDFVNFMKYYHRADFRFSGDCFILFNNFLSLIKAVETRILLHRINDGVVRLDIARKMTFLSLTHWRRSRRRAIHLAVRSILFYPGILRFILRTKMATLLSGQERPATNEL